MARYALVIGIGQYQNLTSLSKPAGDAQAVYDILQTHGDFEDVHLLKDADASQSNLLSALEKLLAQRQRPSDVVVYFTGHGFTAGESQDEEQGYLATYDCWVEEEGVRIVAARKGLSFQRLNKLIERANLSSLVMLLDCCQSEFLIEQALIEDKLQAFGQAGYFLSAACGSFEAAFAKKTEQHSFYTGALIKALKSQDSKGQVTTLSTHQAIASLLKGTGQEPIYYGYGNDLVLVDYRVAPQNDTRDEECPYQGLNAFTAKTKQFFFGRDKEIAEIQEKLRQSNFVAVVGPSGIGKSSVVLAGLVPNWRQKGGEVVIMQPGEAPFVMLKQALRKHWADSISTAKKRQLCKLLNKDNGLAALAQELPGAGQLLLVVDQFEELFTVCPPETAKQFIEQLVAVGQTAESRLAVVMTMRSEFVTNWLLTTEIPESINSQKLEMRPLQEQGLRDVIIRPAALQKYKLGDGLLELVLADVDTEPNSLPLLEFALTELWEQRDPAQRRLTTTAYREMGGLKGALNRRAEAVYGAMGPVEQERAQKVCLQLVRIGKGETDTRWRRTKAELLGLGRDESQRQQVGDVVDDLVKGRLLVTDGEDAEPTIDLAHEALINRWERFVDWRQQDRDQLRLKQRAEDRYGEWKEKGQSEDYLISKGLLGELRELGAAERNGLLGSADLCDFFRLSDAAEQERAAALEEALAIAKLREERTRIVNLPPAKIVEQSIAAIDLVGRSLMQFGEPPRLPAADLLKRSWDRIRERLKYEDRSGLWILFVAFHPSKNCILSCSIGNTFYLWDLEGNQIGNLFEGHSGLVCSVALSPKGDRILLGSHDNTLRLYNLAGNPIGNPFKGHSDRVAAVAFSPQGDRILSGSHDKTIRLWDLNGNQIGSPFEGHSERIRSVAFSPKGEHIISGSDDGTLRLWNVAGNKASIVFKGHSGPVWSVTFSPDGKRILSGSSDKTLRLWNLEGSQIGNLFKGHSAVVSSVTFSPDGERILSGSHDKTLRLWDLKGNPVGNPFEGHSGNVLSVAFSPTGNHIVSGSDDGTFRLWDRSGEQITSGRSLTSTKTLEAHSAPIWSATFSPQGDRILFGSNDCTLSLRDMDGNAIGNPFAGHSGRVISVAFNPSGDRIISGSHDKTLRLWDLNGNQIGNPFEEHSGEIWSVAFSPKGDRIISGSGDSTLRLWDLNGNQIGNPFEGHSGQVLSVVFSPNGERILSGSSDKTLRLWDLNGNQVPPAFEGHSGIVRSVAFSPKGDRILSGSDDGTLRLWDSKGNLVGKPFEGHSRWVSSVAFSPTGKHILSGSNDHTLRLWDLQGNQIGNPFEGHSDTVWSVAFSPTGDRILSGSSDSTLRLWRGGTWQDWLRGCCNQLMFHSSLVAPQTDYAQRACQVCLERCWTKAEQARFHRAQGYHLQRQGDTAAAQAKFAQAKELDPDIEIDRKLM